MKQIIVYPKTVKMMLSFIIVVFVCVQLNLQDYVERLFAAIVCSSMSCPTSMCQIFCNIRESAVEQFKGKTQKMWCLFIYPCIPSFIYSHSLPFIYPSAHQPIHLSTTNSLLYALIPLSVQSFFINSLVRSFVPPYSFMSSFILLVNTCKKPLSKVQSF